MFTCTTKPKTHETRFIAIFAFLWWSGTEPAVSPRYAYNDKIAHFGSLNGKEEICKTEGVPFL